MVQSLVFVLEQINEKYFPGKEGSRKEIDLRLGKFKKPINLNKIDFKKLKRKQIFLNKNKTKHKYLKNDINI